MILEVEFITSQEEKAVQKEHCHKFLVSFPIPALGRWLLDASGCSCEEESIWERDPWKLDLLGARKGKSFGNFRAQKFLVSFPFLAPNKSNFQGSRSQMLSSSQEHPEASSNHLPSAGIGKESRNL